MALALFLGFCRILPIDWASGLGGWIGRTIGPAMGQSRKAARNLRLFASTVMPELKKFDSGQAIDRAALLPDHRLAAAAE